MYRTGVLVTRATRQYLPRANKEREKPESSLVGGEADIESVTHASRCRLWLSKLDIYCRQLELERWK